MRKLLLVEHGIKRMINRFCFSSVSVLRASSSGSPAETSDPAAAGDRPPSQRGL